MKKAISESKRKDLYGMFKRDMYPEIRKKVEESLMQQKTLTLTDSQDTQGDVGMDDGTYCMGTLQRSICASADPSNTEAAAGHNGALCDLHGHKGV
ncbi:hypothetical protein D1007_32542 [Hordeum vulgare]|nr:hypothetical protein D1007_32542 [Hordeum vulgare]